jgi:hypothetical protein
MTSKFGPAHFSLRGNIGPMRASLRGRFKFGGIATPDLSTFPELQRWKRALATSSPPIDKLGAQSIMTISRLPG